MSERLSDIEQTLVGELGWDIDGLNIILEADDNEIMEFSVNTLRDLWKKLVKERALTITPDQSVREIVEKLRLDICHVEQMFHDESISSIMAAVKHDELIDKAILALSALTIKKDTWVKMENEPPKKVGEYLTVWNGRIRKQIFYIDSETGKMLWNGFTPTHWQSLPEPPTEQEGVNE